MTDVGTDLLEQVRDGWGSRAPVPAEVVVVGAGMAGLVAAEQLINAGHQMSPNGGGR